MLTLQFVPYVEIENLSSAGRIRKLMDLVKNDKIVLLEGRLKKEEEAELIKKTMQEIDESFKGIELQVIEPPSYADSPMAKVKKNMLSLLLGNRIGMTIIGPASIVKEIRNDPNKIELLTKQETKKPKTRKKKSVKRKNIK